MSATSATGLLLAVIPAHVQRALVGATADVAHVFIAQHGYAHINHAPRGQGLGAWELGMHRGERAVLQDLDHGRQVLEQTFGRTFLPVLVPPWNRIDARLFDAMVARGYQAVSAFGARVTESPVPGLRQVNAHCDPIRWKSGARFAGETKTLTQLTDHLHARRTGNADALEPTGFLTHHIDLDEQGWRFCERLALCIAEHPGAEWCAPDSVFAPLDTLP